MSVLAVGISHRTAALETLERATVGVEDVPKVLHELQQAPAIDEVMLLSTCNRTEVYAVVETFHGALSAVADVLARNAGVQPEALHDNLYVHYAAAAVEHMFTVASGLDSMVVGETQILGQVRQAYADAREHGTVGSTLHELVQTTLRVGKKVQSSTGLGELGASVVSEALAAVGSVAGCAAVIVGAGSMGALAASQLRQAGVGRIHVVNRSAENARRVADSVAEHGIPAAASSLDGLSAAIAAADLVLTCTGSQEVVVDASHIAPRAGRPLVLCDLGLPRDVDPAVSDVDGVRIVDLETVRRRGGTASPAKQVAQASGIVLDEVRRYLETQRTGQVTPTVTALRKRAAEVVDAEMLRLDRKLPELDADARDEVQRTVQRVVDKLLHAPTVRVKQLAAGKADLDYADALRELFGLDPAAPAVVSTAAADDADQR